MKDRIIAMLARGYSVSVVATSVGCTDSYVSQLAADPAVREQIANQRTAAGEKREKTDDSIDNLEELALQRLHMLLPIVTKPMEALRIFQVANAATRKTQAPQQTETVGVTVNISLPEAAAVQFKLSTDRQVVEVDGRSLATLPSNVLNKQLTGDRKRAAALLDNLSSTVLPVLEVLAKDKQLMSEAL